MKHIKFTYVDAVTGISVASQPATNGPAFPAVAGLQFVWARESSYPTDVPEFFGTCPDDSSTQIDGVLGVLSQADWEGMRSDEIKARGLDRASLAAKIDVAVAAIYAKPMTYSKEYEAREAQAQAYKDAGYTGTVPPRVAGFAEPAGMTAREAADLILSQGVQLRDALDQLSDLRMRKYAIKRAATDEEAQTIFSDTMAAINAIAASLA
jgi:hypothetical protein